MPLTQTDRIATLYSPLGETTLVLQSLGITEQLGRLFSLEIGAISENGNLKPDNLLGKSVSVELKCPRGGNRYFHGFVNRFSRTPESDTRNFSYRITAVPWLWFLTRNSDCRIFQNKKVEEILKDVFGRRGFSDFKFKLSGSYTPWEYCVQYRETDFNFISRMLEQEGIYYYFEHEKEKHTAVFCDSPSAHQPFPKYADLTFRPNSSSHEHDQEHVYDWVAEGRHHTGKFHHTDYDFTKPKVDLKTPHSQPGKFAKSEFEIYDYPGEYESHGDGEQWARVRMEELRAESETIHATADVTGLACGRKFTLSEGPTPADEGDYVVTAVSIHLQSNSYETGAGSDSGDNYQCSFTAIKADTQFRAARLTPKPLVQGMQTAVVTGPAGEEIYTDQYGRVKVQFHWDREGKRDEKTTCWMRVATSWAGQGWGSISLPRIGQEVVVAFLEGDPDQPIVVGSVYNASQMPPYTLPDERTKSTIQSRSSKGGGKTNFNELRFEDKKGGEQLFLHAEKDMDLRVKNDSREFVKKDRHLIVEGKQLELVKEDKHDHVKGKHLEKVDADAFLKVGRNRHEKIGMVDSVEAGMEIHLKAGLKVIIEAGVQLTLKAAGAFVDIGPMGVTIQGPMVLINSGGAAGTGTAASPEDPQDPDKADDGTKTGKL